MTKRYQVEVGASWLDKKTGLSRESLVDSIRRLGIAKVETIRFDNAAQLTGRQMLELWQEVSREP